MSWLENIKTFLFGEPTGERARNDKGRFIPDDPDTPHINEAYEDGRPPTKKV